MDIIDAVCSRKSIRGFKPAPIPRETLKEILEIAGRAPSAVNTQPWEVTVITGGPLEALKRGNIDMINSGATPQPEVPLVTYEGKYRERQVQLAIELFRLLGITREDRSKRASWREKGARFFDAPVGLILSIDKSLDRLPARLLDVGAFVQTICLVALNYGLATCVEDQPLVFPELVRKVTGIPESKRLITAIAIGYPDPDFPANRLKTVREPVENIATWCGWD